MTVPPQGLRVSGVVLTPTDFGYDEARRVFNRRFDRRPEIIVRCQDATDVRAAVDFAREKGLTLSVKGGGHSYAGNAIGDGGLLLDLSPMKAIRIDPDSRTAVVQPGVTCGELDRASQEHGLATPAPTVSSVGVAGAVLGGGTGYLSRKYGLALDNLLSAEIVTADGRLLRASEEENPELFWALRGAGANFGITISLTLRLHEVGPEVLAGQIIYPFERGDELLRFFRGFMTAAPEGFQCYPFLIRIPAVQEFPERFHGHPALDFVVFHVDPSAADFVRPLRELGETILDVVGPLAYTSVQQSFDTALPAGRYCSRARYLEQLSDASIETIAAHVPEMKGASTAVYLEPLGGAIERVHSSATAFAGRSAGYSFHVIGGWRDATEDARMIAWVHALHDAMLPHAMSGVYVNLLGDSEEDRVPAAYGTNYQRLVELKTRWDPSNLFCMNHNIESSA